MKLNRNLEASEHRDFKNFISPKLRNKNEYLERNI